jgi:hypothetical protein
MEHQEEDKAANKCMLAVKNRLAQHANKKKLSDKELIYKGVKAQQVKTIAKIAKTHHKKNTSLQTLVEQTQEQGITLEIVQEFIEHPLWKEFIKQSTNNKSTSKNKNKKKSDKIESSTFIGSLRDDEGDDPELDRILNAKKNRPGQRRRRQLAAQKYGELAKHPPTPKREKKPSQKKKTTISDKIMSEPKPEQESESTEDLHPSWAAKRKMSQISQPFQGKKIKF